MLVSCKYCGKIHDRKYDCPSKPKKIKEANEINKFRWSRKWRTKRNQIVNRDKYLCQVCKHEKRYVYDGLEVHHIVPLVEDFSKRLNDDNLITLCGECHELAESGEISKEYLQNIVPPGY